MPVLKDMPFANTLNVTIGDRYSQVQHFGSTNNLKFAVEYSPIDDLLLRGTVSEVFRAPTIANVFGAPVSSAPKLSSDPCTGYTGTGQPGLRGRADRRLVRQHSTWCSGTADQGRHPGFGTSGFPINPEYGKSFDFGSVYSPHWTGPVG